MKGTGNQLYHPIKHKPAISLIILITLFLSATSAFPASITVWWDRNPEPDIAGYHVHWRLPEETTFHTSIDLEDTMHDPLERSFTIVGLEEGKTYYVGVTAYDFAGQESEMSPLIAKVAKSGDSTATFVIEEDGSPAPESDPVSEESEYAGEFSQLFIDTAAGLQKTAYEIQATSGDINGDTFDDLVLFGTDGIYTSLSDGQNLTTPFMWYSFDAHAGEFQSIGADAEAQGWKPIGCKDMNNDGLADLILSNPSQDRLAVCICKESGIDHELIFQDLAISASTIYGPLDLNGDGYMEFLAFNRHTGAISFWFIGSDESMDIEYSSLFMSDITGSILGVGKFDSSERTGLLMNLDSEMTIFPTLFFEGTDFVSRSFLASQEPEAMQGSAILPFIGDFNGDGIDDLISIETTSYEYFIWPVYEQTITSPLHTGVFFGEDTMFFSTADINGDGLSDLLFRSSKDGSYLISITQ